MSYVAKAPGKLFIAGEYAVTHPGNLAIVSSVPLYLTVTLTPSEFNEIWSDQRPDIMVEWARECGALVPLGRNYYPLVTKTIETVEWYLTECGYIPFNFELAITSELDNDCGVKYGLGSSGAISVATIKAILASHHIDYTPLLVYQLAAITHLRLKSNGSFGDIAASSYDGLIAYSSVDKEWLLEQLENHSLKDVLAMPWKDLVIDVLSFPKNSAFLVGWTGKTARTEKLLKETKQIKETTIYQEFLEHSQICVSQLIQAFKRSDIPAIKQLLDYNRSLLLRLSRRIETPLLRQLIFSAKQFGASAKTSGAGGGDCGIAFVDDTIDRAALQHTWKQHGIQPLLTLGDAHE